VYCNIPGYPSSGPRGCQVTTAQCTPTPHPSPPIHTGWVVASGNRTPNLTFNTSGSPADATNCAGALGCSNLTASGARGGVARDVTCTMYPISREPY